MILEEAIISTLFRFHQGLFPRIAWSILDNINDAEPGLSGQAAVHMIKEINSLKKGKFVVLSGPIGCGKTIASYIGALMFEWVVRIEHVYKKCLEDLRQGYDQDYIEFEIYNGADEYRAFALSFKLYHREFLDPAFILKRAQDILKDAIKSDSRKLASRGGLVVIDDLGREYFTDRGFGIAEWDAFFDTRYAQMLPTIITTNLTPEEFVAKYNERILDRLRQSAEWITVTGGSLRQQPNEN